MSTSEAPTTSTTDSNVAANTTRLVFLASLTVLAAAYTMMAFQMEWRIQNGQIGPGFFPRFVGVGIVVGCLAAIALTLSGRGPSDSSADAAEDADFDAPADGRTAPMATVLAVGAMVIFFVFFEVLGALLSSVLFLALLLTIVNPGRHRMNAAVSVLVPVGLYLLFEVLLDAGLPPGVVLPL
ncbi:MAG TPA: tripartite tricarboxylate transporter TctB family protein [Intrasporangium sp.]|nr:tripartite tricarboxylate transporter TctB family protein [Intrasporangium sp.]